MKKIFLCFVFLVLVGCGNKKEEIIKDEISCVTEDSSFNLVLENGQIVKYIDSIDGELGQETVDILNNEHLVGVTNNDEALNIMSNALRDLNGKCEKVLIQE